MAVTAEPADDLVQPDAEPSRAAGLDASGWFRASPSSVAFVATVISGAALGVALRAPIAAAAAIIAMLPAALIDQRAHRLPNRLVAAAAAIGAAGLAITHVVGASITNDTVLELLTGAALLAGPLLVIHLVQPAAMGFGDVKAAAVLGAATGLVNPTASLVALLIACAAGSMIALATRRRTVAFGPALVLGAALALPLDGWIGIT